MVLKNLDKSFFRLVTMHAFDRRTDRLTDRILIARPRLHFVQRGKNGYMLNEGCAARQ